MYQKLLAKIREVQNLGDADTPLHAPVFCGNERKYVMDAIDSTFVSSVGAYVNRFEEMLEEITGAKKAVACCNGTCALEMALRLAGVKNGDAVITQPISFVATANAIAHIGGTPVFVDIERLTLGLSPDALNEFLEDECIRENGACFLKSTRQRVAACVPMHTFGMPARIEEICAICQAWGIPVVEDAAEALGSFRKDRHCGTTGLLGILSFNGNKTATTGGGGAILANDEDLGKLAKHLTTTAKIPHPYLYRHDHIGWNYRLPNLNAALGCGQLEQLDHFLAVKRKRAALYASLFSGTEWEFVAEPDECKANYWLCAVLVPQASMRDEFLQEANASGLHCRPVWEPLNRLQMYAHCTKGDLGVAKDIASRLVNLPSGVGNGIRE